MDDKAATTHKYTMRISVSIDSQDEQYRISGPLNIQEHFQLKIENFRLAVKILERISDAFDSIRREFGL